MNERNAPLIAFNGVGKSFETASRNIEAVRDVSLEVYPGEIVTLVGPSGCGKSTLLNLAAGLASPTRGSVTYAGDSVAGYNLKTGYMTQNDHLLPWRDVAGNIAVPMEIAGLTKPEIADKLKPLVELVGLAGFEKAYPSQLSGGMRKRTALARLLAYNPETLLLDEPFAALDAQLRLNMQVELMKVSRHLSKTVLFVTHDLDEAVALADRIVVFGPRPGTILRIIDSPLPRDRDLTRLRRNADFVSLTAELWEFISPLPVAERERAS